MKCFYHKLDLDGHCSGALIKLEFPECEMIGIDYGDEWVWNIKPAEVVIMADFCLQPFSDMLKLNDMCNFVWIDHHKTAIEAYKENLSAIKHSKVPIKGLRRDGTGACALVWEYLHESSPPYLVQLLAKYDVFNHEDKNTLPFQYGMRLEHTDPSTKEGMITWKQLIKGNQVENLTRFIIMDGNAVLKYEKQYNAKYAYNAFETIFENKKCIIINKLLANSMLFDSVWDPDKYAAMIAFGWTGKNWKVSLYTAKNDVDVSAIAKKHGGGGHAGAAGFHCNVLPFSIQGEECKECKEYDLVDSELYHIFGSEISFERFCSNSSELLNLCKDIWKHPSKYSDYKDGTEDAYYKFLRFLWVKFPNGDEKQLAKIVMEETMI